MDEAKNLYEKLLLRKSIVTVSILENVAYKKSENNDNDDENKTGDENENETENSLSIDNDNDNKKKIESESEIERKLKEDLVIHRIIYAHKHTPCIDGN